MNSKIAMLEAALASSEGTDKVDMLNELAWEERVINAKHALHLAEESYQLATELGYAKGKAKSLFTIGVCQLRLSHYGQSLTTTAEALQLYEAIGDVQGQGRALNNLGRVYHLIADYPNALAHYQKGLQISRNLKNLNNEASGLGNIGLVYFSTGDYTNAVRFIQEALAIKRQIADRQGETSMLGDLGSIYFKLADYNLALDCQQKSLDIFQAIGDRQGEGITLGSLGSLYVHLGDYANVVKYLQRSLTLKRETGDRRGEAESMLSLGELYTTSPSATDRSMALTLLHDTLQLAETIGAKDMMFQACESIATCYEQLGDLAKSLNYYKRFHQLEKEVFNEASDEQLKKLQIIHEVEQTKVIAEQHRIEAELERVRNVELAAALAEAEAQRQIAERQAREDALTGLFNRRQFDQFMALAFVRSQRYNTALSVAICDIDFFKKVNDAFSHQIGDEVLKTVAHLLKQNCREADIIARYGGEEFVLIFPETTVQNAAAVCEKIRKAIETFDWQSMIPTLRVTMSFGVSGDTSVSHHDKMLSLADVKLYAAKHGGRNQVCF
jgi:diguanylate cyclase (GGDEF)-like protein